MRAFCINFDYCGFCTQIDDEEDEEEVDLTCPACESILLLYEDNTLPIWIEDPEFFKSRS